MMRRGTSGASPTRRGPWLRTVPGPRSHGRRLRRARVPGTTTLGGAADAGPSPRPTSPGWRWRTRRRLRGRRAANTLGRSTRGLSKGAGKTWVTIGDSTMYTATSGVNGIRSGRWPQAQLRVRRRLTAPACPTDQGLVPCRTQAAPPRRCQSERRVRRARHRQRPAARLRRALQGAGSRPRKTGFFTIRAATCGAKARILGLRRVPARRRPPRSSRLQVRFGRQRSWSPARRRTPRQRRQAPDRKSRPQFRGIGSSGQTSGCS
mmetsp:Transcript_97252/g.222831  ORF Transcript_97252/g.222831 Transcript_97252/m.222831 type:complete len:263 (+) Transcript_97252:932-1720(+)